jgi:plastocyanin domain-containing protein
MNTKPIIVSIIATGLLIGGALYVTHGTTRAPVDTTPGSPAQDSVASSTVENGMQYIDIMARGGYAPEVTRATAGMPAVIRVRTENTFDCSTALVIPALGFSGYLERTGVKEIPVPVDKAQGTLEGLCSMGMYTFTVEFK